MYNSAKCWQDKMSWKKWNVVSSVTSVLLKQQSILIFGNISPIHMYSNIFRYCIRSGFDFKEFNLILI